jgi:hypothetical protein
MQEEQKISLSHLIHQVYNHPNFLVGDFYTLSECLENSNDYIC